MTKKILSLLLALLLISFFAACGEKETTTSNDSSSAVSSQETSDAMSEAASSAVSEATSSAETSSDASSGALMGLVDGVYYGEGYSMKIPQGFILLVESEYMVVFSSADSESLSIVSAPNPTGNTALTQEELEEYFGEQFDGFTIQDMQSVKIDGKDAYTCLVVVDVSDLDMQVYTYNALIPTKDRIVSVAMGFTSQDKAGVFQDSIDTLKID